MIIQSSLGAEAAAVGALRVGGNVLLECLLLFKFEFRRAGEAFPAMHSEFMLLQ